MKRLQSRILKALDITLLVLSAINDDDLYLTDFLYVFEMFMVIAFIWAPEFSMMNTSKEMQASQFLINPLLTINQDFQAMQMKTRTVNDPIENRADLSTWKTNKRKKASSPEDPWNHRAMESINIQERKFQVPVRRSHKLSDKITALQKLVSPYGKTDTASVLQEASLYIKLLQEQIQNLFQMLTGSYNSARPVRQSQEIDGRLFDLRSGGFCLVPVSFMQAMTQQQDHADPNSDPRKNIRARTS
ncbi:transcription factor bHLH [Salix suchowensis]|nr:transcription factor bHLH [Salix suchowensis]